MAEPGIGASAVRCGNPTNGKKLWILPGALFTTKCLALDGSLKLDSTLELVGFVLLLAQW